MIGDNEELARLRTALATAQAERDALAAELAVLRTPATDEALVEAAATREKIAQDLADVRQMPGARTDG